MCHVSSSLQVSTEIESLRKEFLDLRNSLREQMDQTWAALGKPVPGQSSGIEPPAAQA